MYVHNIEARQHLENKKGAIHRRYDWERIAGLWIRESIGTRPFNSSLGYWSQNKSGKNKGHEASPKGSFAAVISPGLDNPRGLLLDDSEKSADRSL
jgi:hypothetical protein